MNAWVMAGNGEVAIQIILSATKPLNVRSNPSAVSSYHFMRHPAHGNSGSCFIKGGHFLRNHAEVFSRRSLARCHLKDASPNNALGLKPKHRGLSV